MTPINISREELYSFVWSESLLSISKRYKISDVGLRKICVRMNIPLPGQGHWQKVKSRQRVYVKKLPKDYTGEADISFQLRTEENNETTLSQLEKEIDNNPQLPTVVPNRLSSPDKLIISAKRKLDAEKGSRWGYKGSLSTYSGHLNIRVAKQNVENDALVHRIPKNCGFTCWMASLVQGNHYWSGWRMRWLF